MRDFFMRTVRVGFSKWTDEDLDLATLLWGDEEVTKFICATGIFTSQDIENRLKTEIKNDRLANVQYWPFFELTTEELIGCCGLRPFKDEIHSYELGFHLRKKYWGNGYASEAARAVIQYGFNTLKADTLYAGHHPKNERSKTLLTKLKFKYIGDNFYEPTGLYHPSYEMTKKEFLINQNK